MFSRLLEAAATDEEEQPLATSDPEDFGEEPAAPQRQGGSPASTRNASPSPPQSETEADMVPAQSYGGMKATPSMMALARGQPSPGSQEEAPGPPPATRKGSKEEESGPAPVAKPKKKTKAVSVRAKSTKAAAEEQAEKEQEAEAEETFAELETGEIKINVLEELDLAPNCVKAAQAAWMLFLSMADCRESAGEAIYSALFEGAPTLQSLFVTPRAVQAMRFMNGLASFVQSLDTPAQLKVLAETLGFGHLNLEVTIPRVILFRDAILDLFESELGPRFTDEAREGWKAMMNYIGGAIMYVKKHYAARLRLLSESWHKASGKHEEEQRHLHGNHGHGDHDKKHEDDGMMSGSFEVAKKSKGCLRKCKGKLRKMLGGKKAGESSEASEGGMGMGMSMGDGGESDGEHQEDHHKDHHDDPKKKKGMSSQMTYEEMFQFNRAVMGFSSGRKWLGEVLACWDSIVVNISNSARLQRECDVLALRISKKMDGSKESVNLAEYKSVMLASLRGVLPKVWDQNYEVAWNWLWENVERLLNKVLGKPPDWETALTGLWASIDEEHQFEIRKSIYERFFAAAPIGQDYFKQSNTRLHFIAARVLSMTLEFYQDPWSMVDDISALGLRHVGYGIPTDLFAPFVTACIEVLNVTSSDQLANEAFSWSLSLISKTLVDTIQEGSTIVMKAINANSDKQLRKAIACAPRGKRAQWLLLVQVGTQSISPLLWSLQSGSLAAAAAILQDLLTIRADRERYYYGMEELFHRHPDIVGCLSAESTHLLFILLDGLVWRSRFTHDGLRHANYYIKYLIIDQEGQFCNALEVMKDTDDPKLMSHPVVTLLSDSLWFGIVQGQFIYSKLWFVCSLISLMFGEVLLPPTAFANEYWCRWIIFSCRIFNYALTMLRLTFTNTRDIIMAYRNGEVARFSIFAMPEYLLVPHDAGCLILGILLILMCSREPYFYCALGTSPEAKDNFPTGTCPESEDQLWLYSAFAMWAMLFHWFLLMDLAVFSTGLSAFLLVCVHVLSEIGRFLIALVFVLLTFASAISVLEHDYQDMYHVFGTAVCLFSMTVRVYEDDFRDLMEDKLLLAVVFLFLVASAILLLNLLIAQLNCAYVYVYQNMLGFARLKRAEVIVNTLEEDCPEAKWETYVEGLGLENLLEFNQGDVGISGGVTVEESAHVANVTQETIIRFGGTCSPEQAWPEDITAETATDAAEQIDRIDKLIQKTLKKLEAVGGQNAIKKRQSKLGIVDPKGGGQSGDSSRLSASNSDDDSMSEDGGVAAGGGGPGRRVSAAPVRNPG